jgi:hypothetical protein
VMQETRSRARERLRLPVALAASALLVAMLSWLIGLEKIKVFTKFGSQKIKKITPVFAGD